MTITKGQKVFFASIPVPYENNPEKVVVREREVIQAGTVRARVQGLGHYRLDLLDTTPRAAVERERRLLDSKVESLTRQLDRAKHERNLYLRWLVDDTKPTGNEPEWERTLPPADHPFQAFKDGSNPGCIQCGMSRRKHPLK